MCEDMIKEIRANMTDRDKSVARLYIGSLHTLTQYNRTIAVFDTVNDMAPGARHER